MGMMKLFSDTKSSAVPLPNPNPTRFNILRVWQVGPHVVAEVRYPDCITYEGKKVLLFKNKTEVDMWSLTKLDPHFNESGWSPFARFAPTEAGIHAAMNLAQNLPA